MKRPVRSARFSSISAVPSPGYTLVEILVATVLTLIMVAAAVKIFGDIGASVSDSRATLEMSDRLRAARTRLEMDLAGVTATMLPPLRPENAEGFFQYTEGPVGPVFAPSDVARNTEDPGNTIVDSTVGDFDDILMFTTHSTGRPFLGRCAATGGTIESDVAVVIWFVRGRTLYRRVLLVAPGVSLPDPTNRANFYRDYDLSVHSERSSMVPHWDDPRLVPNTLGDLTKHECRYAHPAANGFPCHPHFLVDWNNNPPTISPTQWATVGVDSSGTVSLGLGLPTLRECSSPAWPAGDLPLGFQLTRPPTIDFWSNPHPWPAAEVEPVTGTLRAFLDQNNTRVAEDVILTNVIGFDVKAWDPVAGGYVDLGYDETKASVSPFAGRGDPRSGMIRVYDTWSFHYEHDGIDQDNDGLTDEGTNGFDDDQPGAPGYGIVDDPGEMEAPPPYAVPLRAIQVKIRVYEPDSRQIHEVTVVQEFLPK